jgi:hypothetical protein
LKHSFPHPNPPTERIPDKYHRDKFCEFAYIFSEKLWSSRIKQFILSVKQWVEKTNSKGIIAKAGRYGYIGEPYFDMDFDQFFYLTDLI